MNGITKSVFNTVVLYFIMANVYAFNFTDTSKRATLNANNCVIESYHFFPTTLLTLKMDTIGNDSDDLKKLNKEISLTPPKGRLKKSDSLINLLNKRIKKHDSITPDYNYAVGDYGFTERELDSTKRHLKKTISIPDVPIKKLGDNYRALSMVYLNHNQLEKAKHQIYKALREVGNTKDDRGSKMLSYFTLAIISNYEKNYNKGLEYAKISEKYVEKMSINHAQLLMTSGAMHGAIGQNDHALDDYTKASEIFKQKEITGAQIILLEYGMSIIFKNKGDYKKAKSHLDSAQEKALSQNSDYFLGRICTQRGVIFKKENKIDSAFYSFSKSLEHYNSSTNAADKAEVFQIIAELDNEINNHSAAIKNSLSAIELLEGLVLLSSKAASYKLLKESYKMKGDDDMAQQACLTYESLQDSINLIKEQEIESSFMGVYEAEQKSEQLVDLKKENALNTLKTEKKELIRLFIFILIIILLITGFLLYEFQRKKKRLLSEINLRYREKQSKSKNTIMENLSHEIRTPVSVVNGYLHLIKQNSMSPSKIVKYANLASNSSNEIIRNSNNFLTLLKIDQNKETFVDYTNTPINTFIINTARSFKGHVVLKSIDLLFKSNVDNNFKLSTDIDKLEKITNNLLTNAIKYSHPQSKISIEVILSETTFTLSVKDQGIGIPEDEQTLIFDRFYQSRKNKSSGGFGIGLSLVKELCQQLKGSISLKSREQKGSTFTMELPHNEPDIEHQLITTHEGFKSLIDIPEDVITATPNFPEALIVEDNLDMIGYLKELLSPFLNCTVAHQGQEALDLLKDQHFDVIISDYRLPVMDGMEFKKALNQSNITRDIPFIMLTATSYSSINTLDMLPGINDYIVKPFKESEILTRIRLVLENKLYQKQIKPEAAKIEYQSHTAELIDKINEILLKNISDPNYSIADLAAACGYSQKQLGKIVKHKTGLTMVKLILEIRLLKAYDLIISNKYPTIMEVIYAVGLTSRSYFNKKFTNRFGIKPNDVTK